jgi:DNA ligase (NAD+)
LGLGTESEAREFLEDQDFEVVDTHIVGKDELASLVASLTDARESFGYDIDGLVIKENTIDSNDDWERPKKKIAYKFAHQGSTTSLLDIIWQVSGERVTPVAVLEPVDIAGVTVSRASLHNVAYIRSLLGDNNELFAGCEVEVTRRNDVIPQIEQILVNDPSSTVISLLPEGCPECGSSCHHPISDEKEMAWVGVF